MSANSGATWLSIALSRATLYGDLVDIGRDHAMMQCLGGGDREHAGAGPDIEDVARMAAAQQPVEGDEAAARGAVMAGAEGERGLDFDRDSLRRALVRDRASRE